MIAVAAVLMVTVCYPVLLIIDHAINLRLKAIGVPQAFAYQTKSLLKLDELEHEQNAILASINSGNETNNPIVIDRDSFTQPSNPIDSSSVLITKPLNPKDNSLPARFKDFTLRSLLFLGMVTEEPLEFIN
jgi:hypothetical protein